MFLSRTVLPTWPHSTLFALRGAAISSRSSSLLATVFPASSSSGLHVSSCAWPNHVFRHRCFSQFDALMTACNGCDTECPGCVFDGGAPRCIDQIDHSYSSGGSVTLETLKIDPGHWRATNKSEKVLPCFNAAACLGGITGVSGYCKTGYDGPCKLFTDNRVTEDWTFLNCVENGWKPF